MWFLRQFSRLPFSVLYKLSSLLSFLIFKVFRYRSKIIRQQIAQAFPEKSASWHNAIANKFYLNFTDVWLETIKTLTLDREELFNRIKLHDYHLLQDHLDRGQTCIALSAHVGNWEWLLLRFSAQEGFKTDAAYQEVQNAFFNKLMFNIRSRFGAVLIERKKFLRALIKRKDLTRAIAMIADQGPGKWTERRYWWTFLNQNASFYTSAAKMAIGQKMPLLYAGMYRNKRGYYSVYFKEISIANTKEPTELYFTEKYIRLIEENIHLQPEAYLWTHRRWKRQPNPEDTVFNI